jgi:hypothetical protein
VSVIQHLTPSELACRWGLHVGTLANMRCGGAGPHYLKLGSRVAYRLIDVEAFEEDALVHLGSR